MTTQHPWLTSLFANIDAQDAASFASHLSPDAEFHFGNLPPIVGREQIEAMVTGFFASIRSLRHTILEQWHCEPTLICRGKVTYVRHDGSELSVPFANFMRLKDGKASEYRIYSDNSALYQNK